MAIGGTPGERAAFVAAGVALALAVACGRVASDGSSASGRDGGVDASLPGDAASPGDALAPDAPVSPRPDGGLVATRDAHAEDASPDASSQAPVDDCSALDPTGVQVLASVCPGALVVDDDWVYVAQWLPGRDFTTRGGPVHRVPRCGGASDVLTSTSTLASALLSGDGVVYRFGGSTLERISKPDGAVTSFSAGCVGAVTANATHVFVVDTCDSTILRMAHTGTSLEKILDGVAPYSIAATDAFVYFFQGTELRRVPVAGSVSEVVDTAVDVPLSLSAGADAAYMRSRPTGSAVDDLVRIADELPAAHPTMTLGSDSATALDQGYLYVTGRAGALRVRATDLGDPTREGEAPIPAAANSPLPTSVVAHADRLYWCEGNQLLTRRASLAPLPECTPRPSAAVWATPATQGLRLGGDFSGNVVRADSSGGIYTVAYESAAEAATSGLFEGAYLLKYGADGAYAWGRLLPGGSVGELDLDGLGHVLVLSQDGANVTTLSKYASDGSLVWANTVPFGQAAFTTAGDVVMVTGIPGVLSKLELAGSQVDSAPVPGNGALSVLDVKGDGAGGVVLTGNLYDAMDLDGGLAGGKGDGFVLRLGTSLAMVQFRAFPGASIVRAAGAPDGGLLVLGQAAPGADFGAGPTTDGPGSSFRFLARYEPSGSLKWRRVWFGAESDLVVSSDGTALMAGSAAYSQAGLSGLAGCWLPIAGSPYVTKVGLDGAFRWAEVVVPDTYTEIGVAAGPAGRAVVVSGYGETDLAKSRVTELSP